MFGLGAPELLIILVILLLLFGGAKLPQLSRSIGQSLREIRRGVEGDPSQSDHAKSSTDSAPSAKRRQDTPPQL